MARGSHGMAYSPLYKAWENMRQRCTNAQAYPSYVGVGCDPRWLTFNGFMANPPTSGRGYEPGLCLARFNDEGDYAPENTRWLTRSENSREQKRPGPKSHCKHGHPYTPDNTVVGTDGRYRCRTCARQRNQEWRQRHVNG